MKIQPSASWKQKLNFKKNSKTATEIKMKMKSSKRNWNLLLGSSFCAPSKSRPP